MKNIPLLLLTWSLYKNINAPKNEINTFNTGEFFNRYTAPASGLTQIIRQDSIRFFIVRVQNMIRLSLALFAPSPFFRPF